jgi:hypothetical protein
MESGRPPASVAFAWRLTLLTLWLLDLSSTANAASPTFYKDVEPIIAKRCVRCHRPAGIASTINFTSYAAIRSWATGIKDAVSTHLMPPWPADRDLSLKFKNDPTLTPQEISTIRTWVDVGAPEGLGASHPLELQSPETWESRNGKEPDLVVKMPHELKVPATGDLPYVQILIPVSIAEDKWVAACEARPGNSSVVHHMAITELQAPEGKNRTTLDGILAIFPQMRAHFPTLVPAVTSGIEDGVIDMLAIYTPGVALEEYGHGAAKLLRGGRNYYLAFNIHYTGNGNPTTDLSKVAFWYQDTPPRHQLLRVSMSGETIIANGRELLTGATGVKAEGTRTVIPPIPPRQSSYELISITAFTHPITLYQFQPHAHFRAKDFKYVAVYPDGREKTLLTISKYDFHWQMAYELESPLRLPAGSKLVITAHYDNSEKNVFNPNPNREVFFRAQNMSTDEMFSPFIQYSDDLENPTEKNRKPSETANAPVLETTGCLASSTGRRGWQLIHGTGPVPVIAQASDPGSIIKAGQTQLGVNTFELIGLSVFSPARYLGEVVSVRGVLTSGRENRLNVTSLVTASKPCASRPN